MLLVLLGCNTLTQPDPAVSETPTYYRDVRPILDNTCARCHTEGGIATSMDDPEAVVSLASAMKEATQDGRMPPPAPDPTCRDYADSDRFVLSDADKATIAAWADAGAPLGDAADAPGPRDESLTTLDPVDQELWASKPYKPAFDSTGNAYGCFLIDVGNADTLWISGMQALVDNTRIVHHVVLFLPSGTDDLWDQGDPHDGFACSGLGQGNWMSLAAWGPGANPTILPDDMGIALPPNAQVILQMHYFNSFDGADLETDQSGYALRYTEDPGWAATNLPLGPTSFTIPAGEADQAARQLYPVPLDGKIISAWPHMHLLGSAIEETVTHEGEENCLLSMDSWDFHNQVTANFLEPLDVSTGDRLKVVCHWDNTADNPFQYNDPPQDVSFGEGTNDEMCFAFTLLALER